MKALFDIQRFKLYAWIGLAIMCMCIIKETSEHEAFWQAVLNCLWLTSWLTFVNYFLYEYRLPRLRWRTFYIGILLLPWYLFLLTEGFHLWAQLGHWLQLNNDYIDPAGKKHDLHEELGFSMPATIIFGLCSLIYKHVRLTQTAQQLRIEKQAAELGYLKAQTNPHFLFNTLNNIYSLARDKSDLAPESILRLSKMLRYMLYETGGAYIAIEQDLKIIGDYIELEKLRYDDSLRINFNYDIEDMKQALPPLLLIPLVENAFKHGVSETRNRPFVDIHLSVKNRQLTFFVNNSIDDPTEEPTVKENIGLSNLRRQLELLYTDHSLVVDRQPTVFKATLKINLSSHV